MRHSIIIPHRDRAANLAVCIRRLNDTARDLGIDDYEIIVVDGGSEQTVELGPHVSLATTYRGAVFNKPRLQNIGIDIARGDALTFLDADAVVGALFHAGAQYVLDNEHLTKLCYRVRVAPTNRSVTPALIERLFAIYNQLPMAFEAYDAADYDYRNDIVAGKPPAPDAVVFGNSHFTIARDKLGDLHFDEAFVGRGYEDFWLNREIARAHGKAYNAEIWTDAEHAIINLPSERVPGWNVCTPDPEANLRAQRQNEANARLYRET